MRATGIDELKRTKAGQKSHKIMPLFGTGKAGGLLN